MTKKILAMLTAIMLIFSLFSFSAVALVDTTTNYGDIDGDGDVDTDDCLIALEAAAGLTEIVEPGQLKRGDINSDGAVTIFDARQILRAAGGLVGLQPTGKFQGFNREENVYDNPEIIVEIFNTSLNRVKKECPGFDKSSGAAVSSLNIKQVGSLGNAASGIISKIEQELIDASEPEEASPSIKGENCDNAMSAETKDYVSNLTADNVLGVKSSYDAEKGELTIQLSIADCEIDNAGQTSYNDVFNPEILQEKAQSVLGEVFGATASQEATRKQFKNAVLTVVIESATGNVLSYTTEYETEIYISQCNFLITKLYGVQYGTKVFTIYDNFQW